MNIEYISIGVALVGFGAACIVAERIAIKETNKLNRLLDDRINSAEYRIKCLGQDFNRSHHEMTRIKLQERLEIEGYTKDDWHKITFCDFEHVSICDDGGINVSDYKLPVGHMGSMCYLLGVNYSVISSTGYHCIDLNKGVGSTGNIENGITAHIDFIESGNAEKFKVTKEIMK